MSQASYRTAPLRNGWAVRTLPLFSTSHLPGFRSLGLHGMRLHQGLGFAHREFPSRAGMFVTISLTTCVGVLHTYHTKESQQTLQSAGCSPDKTKRFGQRNPMHFEGTNPDMSNPTRVNILCAWVFNVFMTLRRWSIQPSINFLSRRSSPLSLLRRLVTELMDPPSRNPKVLA